MGNSNKVRVLELLAILLRERLTVEELMERFDVSRRTVFRYLSAIREAGFHVDCSRGRYRVAPPNDVTMTATLS